MPVMPTASQPLNTATFSDHRHAKCGSVECGEIDIDRAALAAVEFGAVEREVGTHLGEREHFPRARHD